MKIKIISCIIFVIMFSNVAMSQETSLKNIADIDIKGAKKIDFAKNKNSKIGKSKNSVISRTESNVGEVYELDGMNLFVNGASGEVKNNHLEEIDNVFKEMHGWRPGDPYDSKIETFGQYRVLVIGFEFDDDKMGRYSFFAVSKNNKKLLNGALEYELVDKAKAKEALSSFIKSIKFK
jgi:hypothetical protein